MNDVKGSPFNQPVDPVLLGLPRYPEVIKRPMDLGTIKRNIEEGTYGTVEELKSTLRVQRKWTFWCCRVPLTCGVASRELIMLLVSLKLPHPHRVCIRYGFLYPCSARAVLTVGKAFELVALNGSNRKATARSHKPARGGVGETQNGKVSA